MDDDTPDADSAGGDPADDTTGTAAEDDAGADAVELPSTVHVGPDEEVRSGRYRLFRVFPAVPHLNLLDVEDRRLYTIHASGYRDELQETLDGYRTGVVFDGTVVGDPDDPEAAWRLARAEHDPAAGVSMAFAAGVDPDALPAPVREDAALRERGATEPVGAMLSHDGETVGEVWLQPREPLPDRVFLPNVLTGLVPMEPWFERLPEVGEPTAEALVLDTAAPDATSFDLPFGVVVFLTEQGRTPGDDLRERYGLPTDRDADTRPEFDPY
jgi:hypothetical protein